MADILLADDTSLTGHLNALTGTTEMLFGLIAAQPKGLDIVQDDGTGGVIFPGAVRVAGQTILALPESAPADASIPNGHTAIWNNAGTITFRIRNIAGTLSTKTL